MSDTTISANFKQGADGGNSASSEEFTFDIVQGYLNDINTEFESFATNSQKVDDDILSSINTGESGGITSPSLGTFLKSTWENNTIALYDFKENYNNWCVALTEVMIENGINDEETIATYTSGDLNLVSQYRSTNNSTDTKSTDYEAVAASQALMRGYNNDILSGLTREEATEKFWKNWENMDENARKVMTDTVTLQINEARRKARENGRTTIPTGGNPLYERMATKFNNISSRAPSKVDLYKVDYIE